MPNLTVNILSVLENKDSTMLTINFGDGKILQRNVSTHKINTDEKLAHWLLQQLIPAQFTNEDLQKKISIDYHEENIVADGIACVTNIIDKVILTETKLNANKKESPLLQTTNDTWITENIKDIKTQEAFKKLNSSIALLQAQIDEIT